MKKKVVFISIPMTGRSETDIQEDLSKAKEAYLKVTGENIRQVAFLDNYERAKTALDFEMESAKKEGAEFIIPDRMSVWNLGIALCNLSWVDMVLFYGDWEKSRGCRIEEHVCHEYDIPTLKLIRQKEVFIDRDHA